MEEYYQKVIQLQEKLRRSEENRLKLEMKYNEMIEDIKKEEEAHLKKIRYKYKEFLEDDRRRQQRNDKILDALDRIENRSMMWEAKIKKFKAFRNRYQQHFKPDYPIDDHGDVLDKYLDTTLTKYDTLTKPDDKYSKFQVDDYLENKSLRKYDTAVKPEDKYSNLGNINSKYSKTTQQKEKETCYDNNSKTSKDFENSLKQTSKPSCSSSQKDLIASNKYLYEKSPEEVHDELKRLLKEDEKYSQPKPSESRILDSAVPKVEPRLRSTDYVEKSYYGAGADYKPKTLETQPKIVPQEQYCPVPRDINVEVKQLQESSDLEQIQAPILAPVPQEVGDTNSRVLSKDKVGVKPYNFEDLTKEDVTQIADIKTVLKENEFVQPIENEKSYLEDISKIEETVSPPDDNALYEQLGENSEPVQQVSQNCVESVEQPMQQFDEINQPHDDVQSVQQYDENQPISKYDENGQSLEQYDASGQHLQQYADTVEPIQQYDESGQNLQQYDGNSDPLQQYDENGRLLQQYDESGQPLQQYDPNDPSLQQYDENGQPIQQYDENGQPLQQYDENGQPLQQYDENGQPLYDASGQQYYADHSGDGQYYDQSGGYAQYDENGQLLQQYDENGQLLQQYYGNDMVQYDENGQPILQYDENAQYDENGQLIQPVDYVPPQQEVIEVENKAQYDESQPTPIEPNKEVEESAPTNVPQPAEPKNNNENA